jgi:hypothetical protein
MRLDRIVGLSGREEPHACDRWLGAQNDYSRPTSEREVKPWPGDRFRERLLL